MRRYRWDEMEDFEERFYRVPTLKDSLRLRKAIRWWRLKGLNLFQVSRAGYLGVIKFPGEAKHIPHVRVHRRPPIATAPLRPLPATTAPADDATPAPDYF